MLRSLTIRNYALIEYVDLEFEPGLTIITGETGAGKSIMLGALSLVMGGRADLKVIADGSAKSVVEAVFTDVDPLLKSIMEEKGIDWILNCEGLSELTVRRELTTSGRSKIFINDTSVTLQTLASIVPRLLDIHSQHANAKINNPSERLIIIDSIASNKKLREEYSATFTTYASLRRKIKKLREDRLTASRNSDFLKYQLGLLDKLNPKKGELKEIESKFELLSDADEIKENLRQISNLMGDSGHGIQNILNEISAIAEKVDFNLFAKSNSDSPKDNEFISRIKGLLVEARDLYETIDDYNSAIDTDPLELSRLSERMNTYYDTLKRFGLEDADELVNLHSSLKNSLLDADEDGSLIVELESKAKDVAKDLRRIADELSESREKAARLFSKAIIDKARSLGLPNIKFEAAVNRVKISSTGQDEIIFLCSFNKNGVMRPVEEIASGGETSRLMLSMKAILAGHINLPTIIFDEVDTGVSGEIADKMGNMMHEISKNMQVIVITHLPQVAAKGDNHFKVYKKDGSEKTVTSVEKLDLEGRIHELAAMISGKAITGAALETARLLLTPNS